MTRYIGLRIVQAVPMVLGLVTLCFVLLELAPGDAVDTMIGDYPASAEYREQMRERYGLADPLTERYVKYVGNVASGDLGYSFANRQSVVSLIMDRLPNTLVLGAAGLAVATVGGMALGLLAGVTRSRVLDNLISTASVAVFSMPVFWLGQLLLLVFSIRLGWFPLQGMRPVRGGDDGVITLLKHLALPAIAIGSRELGLIARVTRASVRDTLSQHYVVTAISKGVTRRGLIARHVVRNALLPVVTVIGYSAGYLVGGTVLVESVFGWPGMGGLLFDSVTRRDNSVVIGILVFSGLAVLVTNLLTDVAYGFVNPKVRLAGAK